MSPVSEQPLSSITTEQPSKAADISPATMVTEQGVRQIIKQRKRGALSGAVIVLVVAIALRVLNDSFPVVTLAIVAGAIIFYLLVVYALNSVNEAQLRPSYRTWNKLLYNYGSKLLVVFSVLSFLTNIKKLLNPMYGYGSQDSLPRSEVIVEATVAAGTAAAGYSQLKPAAYVERYFKETLTKQI